MKVFSSIEELLSIYSGMTAKEKKQIRQIFAYLINRELEQDIEPSDVLRLIYPKQYE